MNNPKEIWDKCDIDKGRNVSWLKTPFFSEDAIYYFLGKDFCGDLVESLHKILFRRINNANSEINLRGCAIVCGDMKGERLFFKSDVLKFSEVDGIDISDVLLEKAKENCRGFNFRFNGIKTDANEIILKDSYYDFIIGHHGIHHVKNLDNLFKQILKSLKPHGLFFCNEYIGPNYIQVPLSNRIFASITVNTLIWPPIKRITHENKIKLIIKNINFKEVDPS